MTVTAWCPDCEAICYDHTTICTTCGATLIQAPNNSVLSSVRSNDVRVRPLDLFGLAEFRNNDNNRNSDERTSNTTTTTNDERNNNNTNTTATGNSESNNTTTNTNTTTGTAAGTRRAATVRLLRNDIQSVSDEVRTLIRSIHDHIASVDAEQQALLQELIAFRDEWQQIPAILLDPNHTAATNRYNKPTNDEYLQKIPRIVLQEDSTIFHPASLTLLMTNTTDNTNNNSTITRTNIPVVPAEFGTEYCERIYQTTTTRSTTPASSEADSSSSSLSSTPQQPNDLLSYENTYLVVADPITGVGGCLRQCCYNEIDSIRQYHMKLWSSNNNNQEEELKKSSAIPPFNVILFLKRGANVTFVQKALLAQKYPINAVACIIGNNTSEPWPYTMKDSKNESSSQPHTLLNIPVVMTSLQDCQTILQQAITCKKQNTYLKCNFTIQRRIQHSQQQQHGSSSSSSTTNQQPHPLECIICTEIFSVGQTILQLPCQHIFHETCAVQWLSKHNTCPYCRHELPTTTSDGNTTRSAPAPTAARSTGSDSNNTTFYG